MIKIRYSVFETNSSSVHNMTLCDTNDYARWVNGEVLFNTGHGSSWGGNDWPQFVPVDEASKYDKYYPYPEAEDPYDGSFKVVNEDGKTEWHPRTLVTFGEYQYYVVGDFDQFKEEHITPSGDEVIAFGYCGYDG